MLSIHPQYIKDANGHNSLVVLPVKDFEAIIEELEDLHDVVLYDEAKKNDDGERISLSDYLKIRNQDNG
ncbi:MAG: hypothetical protein ABIX01_19215 [Chitinophagaceae bacterium]